MSYGHTPGREQESPAGPRPGFGAPPPYPGQAGAAHPPGWEPGQQASPGCGQPAYGQPGYASLGAPPPTYRAWGITATICGVLFNLILGLPTALIGRRYGKKVTELWASGDVQAAMSASRKARTWLIASTALDVIGLILSVVLLAQTAGSQSNFSNPSAVAASIKTQTQQRLSNSISPYCEPGVTVTSVLCTPSGTSTDHCVDTFSNGQTATQTAVISGHGTSYSTH